MKWSLRIARISGIDVYLHWTFILLLAWMGISLFNAGKEGWNYFGLVLLLFVCVLLHEFGHALVGQRFGVKTDRITLLPIGGVASMERMPEKPWQEFWIAIAGPLVNLFLAACIGIYFVASGQEVEGLNAVSSLSGNFASDLLAVNLTLFAFNLIPAFPMDGGRILRALFVPEVRPAKSNEYCGPDWAGSCDWLCVCQLLPEHLAHVYWNIYLFGCRGGG
ncbi:MAG: M50 family metallopeptidase [Haliscomenobacter sp.]|nr:M50 family metallopeptidase [Haliscomenobacter sp.]